MAISALTVATVKPQTLQTHHPKPSLSFKPIANCISSTKRPVLDVGIGLLAASVVALSPLEATATRIEYYATVGEPNCELNFAKSGLGYCDVAVGSGEEAPFGELINVHYTARFADGTVFDSSYKRARPLTMRIGAGKLIKGLDQGILGGEGVPPMLVGGKRKLQIPPELAYGPEPAGCFSGEVTAIYLPTLLFSMILILSASIREMRSEGSQRMQKLIDEKPSANSRESRFG